MTAHVTTIEPSQEQEAVRLLTRAFSGDPLMRYLFDEAQAGYEQRLSGFFRYTWAVQRAMDWPLLGVVPRTRLAGVACIAAPDEHDWPVSLTQAYTQFTADFDTNMLDRIERYAKLGSRNTPETPQFYVKCIGVRPESHGQGYARLLLDHVHELAAHHRTASGIGLDTENPENVAIYKNLGYELVDQVCFDGIDVFYMFRPNE